MNTTKKIIMTATVALATLAIAFAAPTQSTVNLNAIVNAQPYTLALAYDSTPINAQAGASIASDGIDGSARWDLSDDTKATTTKAFTVAVSGNQNTVQNLSVTVVPGEFTGTVAGALHKTGITPVATASEGSSIGTEATNTINAGLHEADVLCTFTLSWTGDSKLPAASDYSSAVVIAYEAK